MKKENVNMPSSVIAAYKYEPDDSALTITYVSGEIYKYTVVPEQVCKEFIASVSKGRYLNYRIKGNFKFEKVTNAS